MAPAGNESLGPVEIGEKMVVNALAGTPAALILYAFPPIITSVSAGMSALR